MLLIASSGSNNYTCFEKLTRAIRKKRTHDTHTSSDWYDVSDELYTVSTTVAFHVHHTLKLTIHILVVRPLILVS